jgi:hypothetical protein
VDWNVSERHLKLAPPFALGVDIQAGEIPSGVPAQYRRTRNKDYATAASDLLL